MASRDITEGRSTRAIAVEVGLNTTNIWQNTGNTYDCAIAGIPFLTAIRDDRPYERATAQFRKQQFDSQRDPGEQSLSNWWLRSQSSFHAGEGIVFYDPLANPYSDTISTNSYRVKDSYGVDIWTQGQVSLLHETTQGHGTTTPVDVTYGRPLQRLFSAKWVNAGSTTVNQGVILHDGYDLDRIDSAGNVEHWVDYDSGSADRVYAATSDGQTIYWVTNSTASGAGGKTRMEKKLISASTSTSASTMWTETGTNSQFTTRAAIGYVKQRIILASNNRIFEFPVTQSTDPQPIYTHPSTSYVFSSVAESGTAIYVSGYEGVKSSIFKFNLADNGTIITLSSAITAAEMPVGEIVHRIFGYLGYMIIGTNKGVRVASIDAYGTLTYGPLLVHTSQPVYDFCARDSFVWCATGVNTEPGVIRIDLATELGQGTLRFAYAHDVHYDNYEGQTTTTCAFVGDTDQIMFATAAKTVDTLVSTKAATGGVATLTMSAAHNLAVGNSVWITGVGTPFDSTNSTGPYTVATVPTTSSFTYTIASTSTIAATSAPSTSTVVIVGHAYMEHATQLRTSGYVETGLIRFNTLEPKNFKRVVGRGDFAYGSMSIQTITDTGTRYDVVQYDAAVGNPEVTITQPNGAQDSLGLRFTIYRDASDNTKGAVFKGYQLKAVPATPRNRIISIPLMNFDTETDKYNSTIGYEGRAIERLAALEDAETNGDVVTWQDFRTGEIRQCLIEEVKFTDVTPPDKRFTGYGGIITLTIRTV
jgi:hypothetical protein